MQETSHLPRLPRPVLVALLLALLLAALDQTIVSTALPAISGDLGGVNLVSWIATSYLVTWSIATPLYGRLGDLYGRKYVFQTAIVIFLVGSTLCGFAGSMTELASLRALQGLGAGGLMVCAQGIIADLVLPSARGRYTGLVSGVFVGAAIAGPLVGGWLVDHASWRWIFYVNMPLGAVALLLTATHLKLARRTCSGDQQRARAVDSIDFVGSGVLATGIGCLVIVISLVGAGEGVSAATVGTLAAGAVASLATFVWKEVKTPEPILPLYLFTDRLCGVSSLVSFLVGGAWFGAMIFLPLFFQVVDRASATESGLDMTPLLIGLLVASVAGGRVISRSNGYRALPLIGTVLTATGLYCLSRLSATTSHTEVYVMLAIVGSGVGLVVQVLVVVVQNAVHQRDVGVATSTVTFCRAIGSAIGVAALGAVFASRLADGLKHGLHRSTAAAMRLDTHALEAGPRQIRGLPHPVQAVVIHAFVPAVDAAFLCAAVIGGLAAVSAWLLPGGRGLPLVPVGVAESDGRLCRDR